MRYHAVIPTIGRSALLGPLLLTLLADPECVLIEAPCNDLTIEKHPVWVAQYAFADIAAGRDRIVAPFRSATIYESWNLALDHARYVGLPLAVLNDDITLHPGSIQEALLYAPAPGEHVGIVGLNYERRVSEGIGNDRPNWRIANGTYRNHGIGGHAFIVGANNPARVDPRFRWWYGDDDLIRKTRQLGLHCVVALGAPVDHPVPSTSGNQMPWLNQAISEDRALWEQLTGEQV